MGSAVCEKWGVQYVGNGECSMWEMGSSVCENWGVQYVRNGECGI